MGSVPEEARSDPAQRVPPGVRSSLHTHSRYCDGHGEVHEYVEAAFAAGLVAYGASSHAPLPFPCAYAMPVERLDAYRSDVRRAGETFAARLPVFLGLELDYLPGLSDFYSRQILARGFDYFVASVHYVGDAGAPPWTYDESEATFLREVHVRHAGDARPVVEDYYRRVVRMVEEVSQWGVPIIVGHLDRIALWNRDDRYFPTDTPWYAALVDEALRAMARSGCTVEINTSGWTKPLGAPNPDARILSRAARLGVPAIVSADAHRPANVDFRFADGIAMLRQAGYGDVVVPDPRGWRSRPLDVATAGQSA